MSDSQRPEPLATILSTKPRVRDRLFSCSPSGRDTPIAPPSAPPSARRPDSRPRPLCVTAGGGMSQNLRQRHISDVEGTQGAHNCLSWAKSCHHTEERHLTWCPPQGLNLDSNSDMTGTHVEPQRDRRRPFRYSVHYTAYWSKHWRRSGASPRKSCPKDTWPRSQLPAGVPPNVPRED